MSEIIRGFKGFTKDLKCKGFQFEEGKTYKHEGDISICNSGFHFCTDPLDVLEYYPLIDSVFHEVEAIGKIEKNSDGDSKIVTSEIKIGKKLTLKDFVDSSVKHTIEKCKAGKNVKAASGYGSKLAASG